MKKQPKSFAEYKEKLIRKNKYLEELGIKRIHYDIFYDLEDTDKRFKRWFSQAQNYSNVTDIHTWNLDTEMVFYLYTILRMYKDYASEIVDLDYVTHDIDIKINLIESRKKIHVESSKKPEDVKNTLNVKFKGTTLQVIDKIIKNIEEYLKYFYIEEYEEELKCKTFEIANYAKIIEKEELKRKKVKEALLMLSIIYDSLWW